VDEEIKLPTVEEAYGSVDTFKNFVSPFQEAIIAAVDGTVTEISVDWRKTAKDERKSYWNSKHANWCVTTLLLVLLNGIIIAYMPPSAPNSDQHHWNKSGWRDFFVGRGFGIVGDSGFKFNPIGLKKINGFDVNKRKRGKNLSEQEKTENHWGTRSRSVVENTNAQLKKWKVFEKFPWSAKYNLEKSKKNNAVPIEVVLPVLIMLTNRKIKKNPLRKSDWKHLYYRQLHREEEEEEDRS